MMLPWVTLNCSPIRPNLSKGRPSSVCLLVYFDYFGVIPAPFRGITRIYCENLKERVKEVLAIVNPEV